MRNRLIQHRGILRLESLETRNAPSHFGGMAHAALAIHRASTHSAAEVRHARDMGSSDNNDRQETKSPVDPSPDHEVAATSHDPSTNDPGTIDSQGDR
jgi:hypothetical protein